MRADFEAVRQAAARSALARLISQTQSVLHASWRGSLVGHAVRAAARDFAAASAPARLRWWGSTIAVAAVTYLALRLAMPATVAPALPAALVASVAALAALAAWQADAFAQAWPTSTLSRVLPRSPRRGGQPQGTT